MLTPIRCLPVGVWLIALTCATSLGGCALLRDADEELRECDDDYDCSIYQDCISGRCVAECEYDEKRVEGLCIPKEFGNQCDRYSCDSGSCINGVCTTACRTDADCPGDVRCGIRVVDLDTCIERPRVCLVHPKSPAHHFISEDEYQEIGSNCTRDSECVSALCDRDAGQCTVACCANEDCKSGYRCDVPRNNACLPNAGFALCRPTALVEAVEDRCSDAMSVPDTSCVDEDASCNGDRLTFCTSDGLTEILCGDESCFSGGYLSYVKCGFPPHVAERVYCVCNPAPWGAEPDVRRCMADLCGQPIRRCGPICTEHFGCIVGCLRRHHAPSDERDACFSMCWPDDGSVGAIDEIYDVFECSSDMGCGTPGEWLRIWDAHRDGEGT